MLNLTVTTVVLLPAGNADPITLPPEGPIATEHIHEGLILRGERIPIGNDRINTATLRYESNRMVRELNRFLEAQVQRDRDANGGSGIVLVDRRVLRHVEPRLAAHVAAPHPDPAFMGGIGQPVRASMLIRPPMPPEREPQPAGPDPAGYTLYLDRAAICTDNPATDEIGRADTWEQLQWMARGAAPFERGGRLWAMNNRTRTVLYTADINLDQDPHGTENER